MAARKPKPEDTSAAYAVIQRKADAEILRALREGAKDINFQLARLAGTERAELQRSRLLAAKQAILQAQAEIFDKTGRIVEKRRAEAAARAIQVSGRYDDIAFQAVGREQDARALAAGLEATEARAVDTVVARVTGSRVPLAQRVYNTRAWADNQLERRINSGLARGLNADQMAAELRRFVNPNTPGGTRYAAMRLARTEIGNAYHAMAIRAAQLKPWVTKVEWHNSKSHVRKDKCDELNGRLFDPDDVPAKPHPQCLCYITPVVDDDDEAFLDALAGGDFDEFIDQFAARQGIDVTGSPAFGDTPAAPATAPALRAVPTEDAETEPLTGQAALDAITHPLTAEDMYELDAYTGNTRPSDRMLYRDLNDRLRNGVPFLDRPSDAQRAALATEGMDRVVARGEVTHDIVTHRGMERSEQLFADLAVGDVFSDAAYMSTSADDTIASSIYGNKPGAVILRITIPKGTHVAKFRTDVEDEDARTHYQKAKEVILGRETKLRIKRFSQLPGSSTRVVEVEVIP